MDVILLEKVANLGTIGDRVKVKSGYGRNFLLPKGKATLEKHAAEQLGSAQSRVEKLKDFKLTIASKAGTEGKLFGSIGTSDIAEAATKAGHPLARSEVRLPTGPLRMIGEYAVELHLHADVNFALPVVIVPEE